MYTFVSMNFLAHIYLSENQPKVTIGNFIADQISRNKFDHFHPEIIKGIHLHRHIDHFTDTHSLVKQSKKRLHKNYSHYSGVIVDILYDHFLAKNWSFYSDEPLSLYIDRFYELLMDHQDILPEETQRLMPYMIKDNWLGSYSTVEGIGKILHQMNRRTKNRSKMNFAVIELEEYYGDFEDEFTSFFAELKEYAHQKLISL